MKANTSRASQSDVNEQVSATTDQGTTHEGPYQKEQSEHEGQTATKRGWRF